MFKILKYGMAGMASIAMILTPAMTSYAANSEITQLKEQIDDDKEKMEETQDKIEEIEKEIEKKKDDLLDINIELDEMEEERIERYEAMKLRIQYLYENGDDSMIIAFASSKKLSSAMNKSTMTKEIHDYDRKKLEEYSKLINDMEEKQESFEKSLDELETLKKDLDTYKADLEEQISDNEELLKQKEEEEKRRREEAAKKLIPTGTVTRIDNTYTYCQEDLELIYAIVMQEAGNSYDGALAVITCACNRAESSKWGYLGGDPLSQLTARGQFCYSIDTHWKKYLGNNVPQNVRDAVADALGGTRSHQFLSFRGYVVNGGVNIGGNYYFSPM